MTLHLTPQWVLLLSLTLFCIGAFGVVTRRNAILMLVSVELMLNAVNLALVCFSRLHNDMTGQGLVVIVMAVAAAEAALGLAVLIAYYRIRQTLDIENIRSLEEPA